MQRNLPAGLPKQWGKFVAAGKREPNDHIKGMMAPVAKAAHDAISRRIKDEFAAETAIV